MVEELPFMQSLMRFLTDSQIAGLREKVAKYLSERGVELQHRQMLEIAAELGAEVGRHGSRIRFPLKLQEKALQSVPRKFSLASQSAGDAAGDGSSAAVLSIPHPMRGFYVCTGTGGRGYLDPETGEHRPLVLADIHAWGRLAGALEHIDLCAFPTPTDAPPETVDVHSLNALLRSTIKHVWIQPHTEQTLPYLLDLCAARAGGKKNLEHHPLASIIACSLTPFRFKSMDIEVIVQACDYGLPLHVSSLPVIGGTSPITTVGTVLTAAIEVLAMVILTQLIKPGHPVFALATALGMDMLTGRAVKACPEAMQANALSAQFLTEAYGLPVHTAGLTSDAFHTDGQAMVEHSLYGLMVVAAGAAVLGRAGELEAAKTFSPLQLIIDDEIVAVLRRLRQLQGELTLEEKFTAWADILTVPPGGHFLETEHTLRYCRQAFQPALFTRRSRDAWSSEGGKTLIDRARERSRELLAGAKQPEIAAGRLEEMERIVAEADRALVR
jgi:trimethylamine--corrinoid protein Co-methyltransferase